MRDGPGERGVAWHVPCTRALFGGPSDRPTKVRGSPIMCMSCGCGEASERHKPGDITLEDLQQAARNAKIDVKQAADNIARAAKESGGGG